MSFPLTPRVRLYRPNHLDQLPISSPSAVGLISWKMRSRPSLRAADATSRKPSFTRSEWIGTLRSLPSVLTFWPRSGLSTNLIVTRPDRLARSVTDLLRIVEDLKARNVTVRIMSMGVDTSTATGTLILQVLGAVSEFERSVMLERQRAGIAKAKSEGRYKGRAPTARVRTPEVLQLRAEGKTVAQIAEATGISRASVYRAFAEASA